MLIAYDESKGKDRIIHTAPDPDAEAPAWVADATPEQRLRFVMGG